MDVESRAQNGVWYFTKNKYDYGPQTINMEFQLEMNRRDRLPRGKCITNLPEPLPTSTPTTTITTTTSVEPTSSERTQSTTKSVATTQAPPASGNVVPVVTVHSWPTNGANKMKGKCLFTLDKALDDFRLNISLSDNTFDLEVIKILLRCLFNILQFHFLVKMLC